jgi:hypothetical protein
MADRIATLGCGSPGRCQIDGVLDDVHLVFQVGKMLIAASVTMITRSRLGTSMMKAWLMRRSVRRPVALRTTAPISSSVCRLPFISISALPSRASCTALAAERRCARINYFVL